jgi:two-component system OmpR family sensor kinase
VFNNLLSNAIKYSPGDSVIKIRAAIESGRAVVAVEDNGLGIPAADIDRLFERYFRGSNVSGIVGTGVGLNLVKMVVDLHGGEILVESTEGKGSRFTVRLPIAPAPPIDIPATAPKSVPEPERAEEQSGEPAEQQADPARPAAADPLGA